MKKSLYRALEARYQAELYEAKATIEVYFTNAVGIGEHPQDCLLTLEENFKEPSEDRE